MSIYTNKIIIMSKLSTVYDNECLNCGKREPSFYYHEYCTSSCETSHKWKIEEKAEKKSKRQTKKKMLFDRLQSIDDKLQSIDDKLQSIDDKLQLINDRLQVIENKVNI